jgi:hypothetical protein
MGEAFHYFEEGTSRVDQQGIFSIKRWLSHYQGPDLLDSVEV